MAGEKEKDDLQKAMDDLDAVNQEVEKKEVAPGIIASLAKSVANLTGVFAKSKKEEVEETPAKTETKVETKPATEEVEKSAGKEEVIDVTELLDGFRTVITDEVKGLSKSVGTVEEKLGSLSSAVETIAQAVTIICKSHAILHKSFEESPKSRPTTGVVIRGTKGREEDSATDDIKKSDGPTRGQAQIAIESAIEDGKLEPSILGMFNSNPEQALKKISTEISKSYGIPRTLMNQ